MSTAKVRVFTCEQNPYEIEPVEVVPDEGTTFHIKVEHPDAGSRVISITLGPKGSIDITRGHPLRRLRIEHPDRRGPRPVRRA